MPSSPCAHSSDRGYTKKQDASARWGLWASCYAFSCPLLLHLLLELCAYGSSPRRLIPSKARRRSRRRLEQQGLGELGVLRTARQDSARTSRGGGGNTVDHLGVYWGHCGRPNQLSEMVCHVRALAHGYSDIVKAQSELRDGYKNGSEGGTRRRTYLISVEVHGSPISEVGHL